MPHRHAPRGRPSTLRTASWVGTTGILGRHHRRAYRWAMGIRRSLASATADVAARRLAPSAAAGMARSFLSTAIDGRAGFAGAIPTAQRQLAKSHDSEKALHDVIEQHVRLAAAQGFLTQLGGTLALPVTLPANIAGLGVVQLRMTAGIAHLRGHDLHAPRVRLAVLASLLGEEEVDRAVRLGELPGRPGDMAFGDPMVDPEVTERLTAAVGRHLATRLTGKRAALSVTRAVPLVGGGVGAATDAYATWSVGRFADRELPTAVRVTRAT